MRLWATINIRMRKKYPNPIREIGNGRNDHLTSSRDALEVMREVRLDPRRVRDLALLGLSDAHIAQTLGMKPSAFQDTVLGSRELQGSLEDGRSVADGLVVNALLKRALGYDRVGQKIMNLNGVPTRIDTVEHYPPDVGAALAWLRAKRGEIWREVSMNANLNVNVDEKVEIPQGMGAAEKRAALAAVELLLKLSPSEESIGR